MVREFEGSGGTEREVAKRQDIKRYKEWEKKRKGLGLPPWTREMDPNITDGPPDGLRSSKTLRQWADEYCASPKYLKEFVYKKVPFSYLYCAIPFFIVNPTGPLWLEHATNRICHPVYH